MVHSKYFGQKGIQRESIQKHTLLGEIFKEITVSNKKKDTEPYVMKMALAKYSASFKNRWGTMGSFHQMLNNILLVLLRVHLAPKRELKNRKA